jgi:triosephosphate isomerase
MRKPLVAGNWKMNKLHHHATSLFRKLNDSAANFPKDVDVMIAPPAVYLSWFVQESTARLTVGAQDVSQQEAKEGAYTGEISAAILASTGVEYAIVGHSERRTYHGETDDIIRLKIDACTKAGIKPIYCCGENLEERESGRHFDVVRKQLSTALKGFTADVLSNLVVAYEPVWAIGTGRTASSEQAQEMHADIRNQLRSKFGDTLADETRILYGGSCKPSNADSIFSQPDVDGGLIGGAALVAQDFIAIIEAAGR